MPKLKIQNRFGIIPNMLLNDPKITWKAKGLYGYLQSKPDDWDFAVNRMIRDAKDGRDGTNNGLKELEDAGYLQRSKFKNEKGQWDIEYTLFDHPNIREEQEKPEETTTENPSWIDNETTTENPSTENPSTENTETNKKRNTKKEIQKKKYINNEKINEKFLLFIEHRKQMKKPMTEIAIDQAVVKINNWLIKYTEDQILFVISKSIENSWQGLFETQVNYYNNTSQGSKKLAYETSDRDNFNF